MSDGTNNIQVTKVYSIVEEAAKKYTTISCQGGSRSGKTRNIMFWLVAKAMKEKSLRISVVRGQLPALKRSVLQDFYCVIDALGIRSIIKENKTDLIFRFPNGSWFEFFSCDDEEKLKGVAPDILFVNEATEILPNHYMQLNIRTNKLRIIDYNPSYSDEHWIASLNKKPNVFHFITTYKDNPFLSEILIDEIESLKDTNKALYQIYALGIQAVVEGLVFPIFNIVNEFPNTCRQVLLTMDLGYRPDPTAILKCGVQGRDIFVQEITYQTYLETPDIIQILKPHRLEVISEIDNRLIAEVYKAGVNIKKVIKPNILPSIYKLQGYNINVTSDSINLIKELRNYVYKQDKEGKYTNEPIGTFNHAIDALRYYATRLMDDKPRGLRRIA